MEPRAFWPEDPRELLVVAAYAGDGPRRDQLVDLLTHSSADDLGRAALDTVVPLVGSAWSKGWSPAELLHIARVRLAPSAAHVVAAGIAADHETRPPGTLSPTWVDQVHSLDLPAVDPDGRRGWWSGRTPAPRRICRDLVVAVELLLSLPDIEKLLDGPGSGARGTPTSGRDDGPQAADDPLLARIRGLLAKAESTPFEEEALAYTAKAAELMARHSVDEAVVSGRRAGDKPSCLRIVLEPPYAREKSLLLHVVADANRSRAVHHVDLAMASVVGFAPDLAAVQTLFTSLLVQAQAALVSATRAAPAGSHARSVSFRSAFLRAYATRIGQRLEEVGRVVVADAAASDAALLPVLAARSEAVDDAVASRFASLSYESLSDRVSAAGWMGGTRAADAARLSAGDLTRG